MYVSDLGDAASDFQAAAAAEDARLRAIASGAFLGQSAPAANPTKQPSTISKILNGILGGAQKITQAADTIRAQQQGYTLPPVVIRSAAPTPAPKPAVSPVMLGAGAVLAALLLSGGQRSRGRW